MEIRILPGTENDPRPWAFICGIERKEFAKLLKIIEEQFDNVEITGYWQEKKGDGG